MWRSASRSFVCSPDRETRWISEVGEGPDGVARTASIEGCLDELGGFELAALAGCMVGAAERGIPVLLDGFIVGAAALVATRHRPETARALWPATASAEPGHQAILEALGLGQPIFELGLRLGEASGATLAIPVVRSAAAIASEMATLAEVLG